jgi:type I restriction enzyme S subunit
MGTAIKSGSRATSSRFDDLPPEWTVEKIADVAKVVGGSTPSRSEEEYWGGEIPWATPTDITGLRSTTISETEDKITEKGFSSASTHVLPEYSVLMTSRATIGACAINTVPMTTNQGFQSLVPGDSLNPWYLFYRMIDTAPYLESLGAGSTFSEVSKRVVEKVEIPVPPLPEQRKIASVLATVDAAIQKTEAIIEQAKRVKRGLMQDLLTKGVRRDSARRGTKSLKTTSLGKFPGSWSLRALNSLVSESVTYGIVQPGPDVDGGIPFIRSGDAADDRLEPTSLQRTTEEIAKSYSRSRVNSGELIVTIRATVGRVHQVPDSLDGANLGRGVARIAPTSEIKNRYLYWALQSSYVSRQFRMHSKGSTYSEITLEQLGKLEIALPPSEEQRRIANILDTQERKIFLENDYLSELKDLKKGLMQDFLSGRVRTADKDIDILDEVAAHG